MYLMYVDESGDCGALPRSPCRYFALAGLVVHELRWQYCMQEIGNFRRRMKARFGLLMREEVHAANMISRPGALVRIPRNARLTILRSFADQLARLPDLSLIPVVVDKAGKPDDYDVFETAWKTLIQSFEDALSSRNLAGLANPDERGMLFPDHTDERKLTRPLRKMRHFNPAADRQSHGTGHGNLAISKVIEDPSYRRSEHSYFIQAADLAAFLLYQRFAPSAYMREKGGGNYFGRLDSIVCKAVAKEGPQGVILI